LLLSAGELLLGHKHLLLTAEKLLLVGVDWQLWGGRLPLFAETFEKKGEADRLHFRILDQAKLKGFPMLYKAIQGFTLE
jgi:hypothetical protein